MMVENDSPWKRPPDRDPREGVQPCHCPHCGQELDAATDTFRVGARPKPGDISVCLYCAAILQFNAALQLEAVTGDELILVKANPDVKRAVALVRQVMSR
jgi:hypothetical protein